MNRRSDHHRRKGTWLSLRDLCKPEENHLAVERLVAISNDTLLRPAVWPQARETEDGTSAGCIAAEWTDP